MRILALSGWGQPHDVLSAVVPAATHVDYVHLESAEAALAKIGKVGQACDAAIGWSLGGQLLVRAIAEGLIKPKRLVLIATPFQFVATKESPLGMPADTFAQFRENYANDPERTLRKAWELIAYGDEREHKVRAAMDRQDVQKVLSRNWLRWLDLLQFSCEALSFKKFPPTLLVHGEKDAVVWPNQAERFAAAIPKAKLELWEGCGHAPHWHDTDALKALVKGHMDV